MQLSTTMKNRLVEIASTIANGDRAVGSRRSRTDAALVRRGLISTMEVSMPAHVSIALTDAGLVEADRLRAERGGATPEKRTFAVFNTARGDIRVHADDCPDVARDRKRYGAPEIIHAADKRTVVADFMSDFVEEGEPVENLDGDFVWIGCCGDLPWETPTTDETEALEDTDEDDYANVMFPAELSRVRAAYPVGTHVTGVNRRGERASGTVTGYVQSGSPRDGYRTGVEIEHADGTGAYTLINAEDVDAEIPAPSLPKRTPSTQIHDAIDRTGAAYTPGHGWTIHGITYSSALDAPDVAARSAAATADIDALFVDHLPAVNADLPAGVEVYGNPVGYSYTCAECRIRPGFLSTWRWASTAYTQATEHAATEHIPGAQDAIDHHA